MPGEGVSTPVTLCVGEEDPGVSFGRRIQGQDQRGRGSWSFLVPPLQNSFH